MMKTYPLVKSFGYALQGIVHAVRENRNLKIHIVTAVIVFFLALFLRVARNEVIDLLVMIILVISAEMINTSVEEMTDLIVSEHRQEAKAAKDVAAGMVLVVSIGAALVGLYIFVPYILRFLSSSNL